MKLWMTAASAALMALASSAGAQDKPQLAFVVNAASDFWKLAEAGVNAAQAELPDYEVQFRYPAQGTAAASAKGTFGAMRHTTLASHTTYSAKAPPVLAAGVSTNSRTERLW